MRTIVAIFFFTFTAARASGLHCQEVMASVGSEAIHTAIHELAQLRLKLDVESVQGNPSLALATLSTQYGTKEGELSEYLQARGLMAAGELILRLHQEIENIQGQNTQQGAAEKEKKEVEAKALEIGKPPVFGEKVFFYEIQPVGKPAFQISACSMTQRIFATLMVAFGKTGLGEANPSNFLAGNGSVVEMIHGVKVHMRPNNPVEKISRKAIMNDFLVHLNRMSQEGGPLDQDFLRELIADHQKGDLYKLPSSEELDTVYDMAHTLTGEPLRSLRNATQLEPYMAFNTIPGAVEASTYPVDQYEPFWLGERPIYLHGNVREWTRDEDEPGIGTKIRGLGWNQIWAKSMAVSATPEHDQSFEEGFKWLHSIGFRLVRYRKPVP